MNLDEFKLYWDYLYPLIILALIPIVFGLIDMLADWFDNTFIFKRNKRPIKPSERPMPEVKPPLGAIPTYIWKSQRMRDLKGGISRYMEVNKEIPLEWVEEYNTLVKRGANES